MASRKAGATTRPASGGTKSKDKGTRGGRPEASATAVAPGTKPARTGNGQQRSGNGQSRPAGQAQRARTATAAVAAPEAIPEAIPAWFQWTTWALSLAGLGVSIYLTIAHFNTSVSLVCPASSTINCEKVTTSPQSYLRWARIGSVVVGMVFVLYLIYCELFKIGAICLWCTSVHVITFCLFGLIVFSAAAGYSMIKPAART